MSKRITLGIDLGNHSVKTSSDVIFKSQYEDYDYKHEVNGDKCIMYNGNKYVVGKGVFDYSKVKSERKNTIPLYLNAIYQSINGSCDNVRVVVGLPLEHHKDKNIVEDMKKLYTGRFEFRYGASDEQSEYVVINVKEVFVFPECLGAFYSLDEDMNDRDVLLIDIGGGTVNVALFTDGEYVDSTTYQEGVNDVYRQIMNKANFINTGATFDMESILTGIRRGFIKWDGKKDEMKYIKTITSAFVTSLINDIKGKFPLYKSYEIYLSGGGADLLEEAFANSFGDYVKVENNVFANAIGFYNVGTDMDE